MKSKTIDVEKIRTMRTECAGTGPTQGGMHPRYADGSSSFYGRAMKEPTHYRDAHGRLVSRNHPKAKPAVAT